MTTLAELGLKQIVRDNGADFHASLYVDRGQVLAHMVRRQPPIANEHLLNARLLDRADMPADLTDEQFARAKHWFECHCKASQCHFALLGKSPRQVAPGWTVFE